jgi:probable rRNA maturation factor
VPDDATELPAEPDRSPGLAIDLVIDAGDWSAIGDPQGLIARAADAVAQAVDVGSGAMATVVLSSDAEVRRLNAQWCNKDKPTNVLSFPAPEQPGANFLGDVILAAETVAAEARDGNLPFDHHVSHLVVHGLLHLLGFDHETDAEAEEMETLETGILAGLGVPDPYAETCDATS